MLLSAGVKVNYLIELTDKGFVTIKMIGINPGKSEWKDQDLDFGSSSGNRSHIMGHHHHHHHQGMMIEPDDEVDDEYESSEEEDEEEEEDDVQTHITTLHEFG